MGVAEVQPPQPLGDHDREAAVGGEVQVVGVHDPYRRTRGAGTRVDRGQAVALAVADPQPPQVPGRRDVLRLTADGEVPDDPEVSGSITSTLELFELGT